MAICKCHLETYQKYQVRCATLVEKAYKHCGGVSKVHSGSIMFGVKRYSCLTIAKSLVLIRNILTSEHHLIICFSILLNNKSLLLLHLGLVYEYLLVNIVRFIYNGSFICMYSSNDCRTNKSEKNWLENCKLVKNEHRKYQ